MLNQAILMGRLTADPELKKTQSDKSVTSFRIAVERAYVKEGEERQADFINIVCWGRTADFVCKYFKKGSMIAVVGEFRSRTYLDKNDNKRYIVEILATKVSFTGERREQPQTVPAAESAPPVPEYAAEPIPSGVQQTLQEPDEEEYGYDFYNDLPFDNI